MSSRAAKYAIPDEDVEAPRARGGRSFSHEAAKVGRCRSCHKELTIPADIQLGSCFRCHRPHNGPSCVAGHCSAGKMN